MIKMIKIEGEGLEQFGCPIVMIFLAHDIEDAKDLFYAKYPATDSSMFQEIIDKFGYEVSTTLFEVYKDEA